MSSLKKHYKSVHGKNTTTGTCKTVFFFWTKPTAHLTLLVRARHQSLLTYGPHLSEKIAEKAAKTLVFCLRSGGVRAHQSRVPATPLHSPPNPFPKSLLSRARRGGEDERGGEDVVGRQVPAKNPRQGHRPRPGGAEPQEARKCPRSALILLI